MFGSNNSPASINQALNKFRKLATVLLNSNGYMWEGWELFYKYLEQGTPPTGRAKQLAMVR